MKQYRFNLDEEQYGYVYFDASSYTDAVELLGLVQEGELDPAELPNAVVKIKNGQCTYDNLEEVKD
jgi:hypothetical protein